MTGDPPSPSDPLSSRSTGAPGPASEHFAVDPAEEAFYAAVLRRILRYLLILIFAALPFAAWRFGWIAAAGFACGGLASWINFHFLAKGAEGLADRIVNQHSRESGGAVVSQFLLRYLLVGAIGYVILKGSPVAFRGFLWGLTLPVAAMLIEVVHEAFVAFSR